MREIIQNKKLNFKPIGFIDDDPSKKGARIDGYPVMGSTTSINDIVASKQIDKIIISITDIGREKLKEIYNQCENTGKPVMRARISFDPLINTNFIEEAYLDQISPDSED